MKKRLVLFLGYLFLLNDGFGQDVGNVSGYTYSNLSLTQPGPPPIFPVSPDASNFIRFGNLPIKLVSGAAEYNLPLYTITSGSLTHPVNVAYTTNGIKVDEMPTAVGLGWTLLISLLYENDFVLIIQ